MQTKLANPTVALVNNVGIDVFYKLIFHSRPAIVAVSRAVRTCDAANAVEFGESPSGFSQRLGPTDFVFVVSKEFAWVSVGLWLGWFLYPTESFYENALRWRREIVGSDCAFRAIHKAVILAEKPQAICKGLSVGMTYADA